jgi:drug/metabolite transporter (DMT)-like permease
VIYGITAAGAWGVSTLAAVRASRTIGTYLAVLASQVLGAAALGVLAVVLRPGLGSTGVPVALGLAGGGLLGLAGYATYYAALRHGPVASVTAISAAYGGVAAALAVVLMHEHLATAGIAGVAAAIGGVVLVARSAGPPAARPRHARHHKPAANASPARA